MLFITFIFNLYTFKRSENHGSGDHSHTVHYHGHEEHLRFEYVFIAKQANQDAYLEVGEFSFPFQFALPPSMPTSFEHSIGRTRYSINGTIDIPWYNFNNYLNASNGQKPNF